MLNRLKDLLQNSASFIGGKPTSISYLHLIVLFRIVHTLHAIAILITNKQILFHVLTFVNKQRIPEQAIRTIRISLELSRFIISYVNVVLIGHHDIVTTTRLWHFQQRGNAIPDFSRPPHSGVIERQSFARNHTLNLRKRNKTLVVIIANVGPFGELRIIGVNERNDALLRNRDTGDYTLHRGFSSLVRDGELITKVTKNVTKCPQCTNRNEANWRRHDNFAPPCIIGRHNSGSAKAIPAD
mmetsp:Transcript_34128/g.63688  ORF Transcript_34128/g.63688 Transcript_34128/m.63688 type:complete len:241 (-) Transcript_34128:549-1271(-)